MSNQTEQQIEDIEEAALACRPVRPHGPWRIRIGDEHLDFRAFVIDDPVPTALQLLEFVGARPPEEYMVFQLLRGGELEELRPTETTDLRKSGVERFLVFKGSASYRFELDGRVVEWGKPVISRPRPKETRRGRSRHLRRLARGPWRRRQTDRRLRFG